MKIGIGCCGAYCRTCRALADGSCKGCRLGYGDGAGGSLGGARDISRARCAVKRCCFGERGLATCADCSEYSACDIVQGFYARRGHKYGRYRQATEFIRAHGYAVFLRRAEGWRGAYGALE